MNITNPSIKEMCHTVERQQFDRKSARIDATAIATPIIAFANADGGLLAVGIEDNGEITGIDAYTQNINELLRAPFDFCKPSVHVTTEMIDCTDSSGNPNHILLFHIPQSNELHTNHKDEVFLRMGDKSRKLNFDERLQLMYAKGERYYEDEPVYASSIEDIDLEYVASYCQKIGYQKSAVEYIRQNKNLISKASGREEMSTAAILLFGKEPQRFFKRAQVRFIRYEGTEAKVGAQMNVIKDKIFTGRIIDVVQQSVEFVRSQIKEHTYLGADGRFVTEPEYPEFVWKELIVNAIAHRDYSIKGTDIQIKMFDDHLTVESPGSLPGIVRISNMRQVHFSRNPKIAELLQEYAYVREFGEGVDRIFSEMENAGLPAPEYKIEAFLLHATIKNRKSTHLQAENPHDKVEKPHDEIKNPHDKVEKPHDEVENPHEHMADKVLHFCSVPRTRSAIVAYCGYTDARYFAKKYLHPLLESGQLTMTNPSKPRSKNQRYVTIATIPENKDIK